MRHDFTIQCHDVAERPTQYDDDSGKEFASSGLYRFQSFNMQPAFAKDLAAWHAAGKIKSRQTVLRGIEKAPEAFFGLFKGQNIGKMLVKLN